MIKVGHRSRNGYRGYSEASFKSRTSDAGHRIGVTVHGDAGWNRQFARGFGGIVWIAVVLGHYSGGEVGTIYFIVERLTGRTGKSNLFSGLEHGGK